MSVMSTGDQSMIWEGRGCRVAVEVRIGVGWMASEESTSMSEVSVVSLPQTEWERDTTPNEIVLAIGSSCE